MKSQDAVIDARWMGHVVATDPEFVLPERPRVMPEIVVLPFGESGLLLVGAKDTQVLSGRTARSILPRLLPALTGEHTLEEIAARFPQLQKESVRDIVALLFSRGLLEDGRASEAPARLRDIDSFLGRHIDVTRVNRNRQQALDRLRTARVVVGGTAAAVSEICESLAASGIGKVEAAGPEVSLGSCDLVIAVATLRADDPGPLLTAAHDAGVPALHVRVGGDAVQIGPLIIPGQSACYDCVRRVYEPPKEDATPESAQFWVSHAALQACHLISRIANPLLYNNLQSVEYTKHGMISETRTVARVPGCARCGLDGQALDVESPEYMAWLLHSATAMPPRELLSPREHQQHYYIENVKLTRQQSEATYGAQSLPLPSAGALGGPLPWTEPAVDGRELDLEGLAAILSRSAGLHPTRNNGNARVAPTGGNLGSVELFVIAQRVEGLAPGIYRYHAPRHMLERYPGASIATIRGALGTRAELPSCVIVGAGALGKARSKYNNFGYRLVHFDAGVAITYIRGVAAGLGIPVEEYADFYDTDLAEIIGLHTRDSRSVPTFALGLGTPRQRPQPVSAAHRGIQALDYVVEAAQLPRGAAQPLRAHEADAGKTSGPRPILRSLEEVLLTRHAVRAYTDQPVSSDLLRELLRHVADACRERGSSGAAAPAILPYMAVQVGSNELPAGFYTIDPAAPAALIPVRPGATYAELHRCVLQSSLAAAPIVLFLLGNFGQATREHGARGYRELLIQAGAALGRAWLAATAYGLGGCASGGFMEAGLRSLIDIDGYSACPLIALCLGYPADGID